MGHELKDSANYTNYDIHVCDNMCEIFLKLFEFSE